MGFKDIIAQDIGVFLNPDEFGEEHEIDGAPMMIIIDNNEHINRQKRRISNHEEGLYKKQVLFYASANTFGNMPIIGRMIRLDKKTYTIADAICEDGIYSITLEANKS